MKRSLLFFIIVLFFCHCSLYARRKILSIPEVVKNAELIVAGKITTVKYVKQRAYGIISIRYVLRGNIKAKKVVITWVRNSLVSPRPKRYKKNDNGIWLLKKFRNTNFYYVPWESFYSKSSLSSIRKILAILKIPSYKVPYLFKQERKK